MPAESESSKEKSSAKAMEAAIRFLETRGRSVQEVQRRLTMKGHEEEAINIVVEKLKAFQYLDDHAFAFQWAESRRRSRNLSYSAIARELREKGISQDIIDEVMLNQDEEESIESAIRIVQKRLKRETGFFDRDKFSFDRKAEQRAVNAVLRKGYSYSTAAIALSRYKDILVEEEEESP